MSVLVPVVESFNYTLHPLLLGLNTLDVLAAIRLCIILRQIKDILYAKHLSSHGKSSLEDVSFTRSLATTLLIVYGGETMISPLIGRTPSFLISGIVPTLYIIVQAIVDSLPFVPPPSLESELPLAILDAFTRSMLLCTLVPPLVITHPSSAIATSPWTLLLTSLVTTNGGFFLANLLSFLQPTALTVTTPPELRPYGWTTTDIWSAPLITGIYALLTHSQPFWADAHTFLVHAFFTGGLPVSITADDNEKSRVAVEAVDPDVARAACAAILAVMFASRTIRNFREQATRTVVKSKTQ